MLRVWRRVKVGTLYDDYARVKRFLLIYIHNRLNKIQYHFWNYGGNIKEQQQKNVAEYQKNYLFKYKQLVMKYCSDVGVQITGDLQPPFETNVQIKVVKEYGDIINENGDVIKLNKGSVHFVPFYLVENLVGQGYLVVI